MRPQHLISAFLGFYCSAVRASPTPPPGGSPLDLTTLPDPTRIHGQLRKVWSSGKNFRSTYSQMREKGLALYLSLQCGTPTPQPRLSVEQLKEMGWSIQEDSYPLPMHSKTGIEDLHISSNTADYRRVKLNNPKEVASPTSKPPYYEFRFGPAPGVIVSLEAYREKSRLHWSDVVASMWYETCKAKGVSTTSLRYVFRNKITNDDTIAVWMQDSRGDYSLGRKVFYPYGDTADTFMALLGSPNGRGVVPLLLQHADDIGPGKTVTSITVDYAQIFLNNQFQSSIAMWLAIDRAPAA